MTQMMLLALVGCAAPRTEVVWERAANDVLLVCVEDADLVVRHRGQLERWDGQTGRTIAELPTDPCSSAPDLGVAIGEGLVTRADEGRHVRWTTDIGPTHDILAQVIPDPVTTIALPGPDRPIHALATEDGRVLWTEHGRGHRVLVRDGWVLFTGAEGIRLVPHGESESFLVQKLGNRPVITTKGSGVVQEHPAGMGVWPPFILVGGNDRVRWIRVREQA